MSEDDLDQRLTISWLRGQAIGLRNAAEMLRARSGKMFAGGMDAEARAVRQLAAEIEGAVRAQRRRCREYCDEQGLAPKPCDEDKP